jgi:hypothetical protein
MSQNTIAVFSFALIFWSSVAPQFRSEAVKILHLLRRKIGSSYRGVCLENEQEAESSNCFSQRNGSFRFSGR